MKRKKRQLSLFKPKPSLFDNLTWTCHICHQERPDAKISVRSSVKVLDNMVRMTENIRYCNDNPDCIEKAKTFRFLKIMEENDGTN